MNRVSKNREKKEKIVAKLADKVGKAKSLVFVNYQGLTHKQIEQLKKALKQVDAELAVTKNTLLKLALQKVDASFEGPTATLFLYGDPIEPLKQLVQTFKELNLLAPRSLSEVGPTIKLGIIDGKTLTSEQVLKLATLPSRDILITQLIFQMKAPIYRLHRALGWNMQRLVLTLKAIEKTKVS